MPETKAALTHITWVCSLQLFIGFGFPYEGPAPLEAIANGCVFLQARFNPPHSSLNHEFFRGKPTSREASVCVCRGKKGVKMGFFGEVFSKPSGAEVSRVFEWKGPCWGLQRRAWCGRCLQTPKPHANSLLIGADPRTPLLDRVWCSPAA